MKRFLLIALLALAMCSGKAVGPKGPPSHFHVWGIDLSRYQGRVDWAKVVEKNRPDFVFLKATEGQEISDPLYDVHARQLDEHSILRGAYHFFGHRTPGKEQAQNFIRTAKLAKGNLIPVLDIEKHRFMVDPRQSVREAKAFCSEIKRRYGVNPIIYCSSVFYREHLAKDFPASRYVLWIADYRGNPDNIDWDFWQHTCSHKLKGMNHEVDRNVYCGTMEDLQKYILK